MGVDVIIFDEPTAGVDEKGRSFIIGLAQREHKKGKTIIWISHDMDEVAEIADRVLVLDKGCLVNDGTPAEVFSEEEQLSSLGLAIPTPARLVRALKSRGMTLPAEALTMDEAYEEIIALKGGDADV